MNSDLELKRNLRRKILNVRDGLSATERKEKSLRILESLQKDRDYLSAKTIFFFAGYGSEVETDFMIEDALARGKEVAVPKVLSRTEMSFFRISSLDDLHEGFRGIREPDDERAELVEEADLMIMPGLVFDTDRNRIGYGGGYYDRFLSLHKEKIKKIAICFEEQIADTLPYDEFDIRPDRIITDKRIIN